MGDRPNGCSYFTFRVFRVFRGLNSRNSMKTPREILLERHRAAEPNLDAIRQTVLDDVVDRSRRREEADSPIGSPVRLLTSAAKVREFLLSIRWHLAGLSVVWLAIAVLNVDHSSTPATTVAKQNAPSPRQILTALRENRRQLLELIGSSITEPTPAPRPVVPQRRGELQSTNAMA